MPTITIKNVSLRALELPAGAMLQPGQTVKGVEDNDPLIRSYLNVGSLIAIDPKPRTKKENQS